MHSKAIFLSMLYMGSVAWCQNDDVIVRQDFDGAHHDGSYRWAVQTGGGIFHEQRGSLHASDAEDALQVEGQYQYTAPNGQVVNILYTAGEDGFIAKGDNIPTPPPIPRAIQRALEYLATLPPSMQQRNAIKSKSN